MPDVPSTPPAPPSIYSLTLPELVRRVRVTHGEETLIELNAEASRDAIRTANAAHLNGAEWEARFENEWRAEFWKLLLALKP